MLSLSPAKILIILVVALIVLGPEKLPGVARQVGAAWGDLRKWRRRLETDVRGVFPDLPPAHQVAQAVRSPLAFLDRLADEHERASTGGEASAGSNGAGAASGSGPPSYGPPGGRDAAPDAMTPGVSAPDDPSMN